MNKKHLYLSIGRKLWLLGLCTGVALSVVPSVTAATLGSATAFSWQENGAEEESYPGYFGAELNRDLVLRVRKYSPAGDSGLLEHDRIVAIDGLDIRYLDAADIL